MEIAPKRILSTTTYNGQFPGPLLRFKEGRPVTIEIHNETDTPEQLHWHGQFVPVDVDGAAEEGTPYIPAHGARRISFIPKPAGFRFYHTHVVAGSDLNRGTYTGLAGPVYVEPASHPGAYDREIFLVMKEFAPAFSRGVAVDPMAPRTRSLRTAAARAIRRTAAARSWPPVITQPTLTAFFTRALACGRRSAS